jgi:hypothetical protein
MIRLLTTLAAATVALAAAACTPAPANTPVAEPGKIQVIVDDGGRLGHRALEKKVRAMLPNAGPVQNLLEGPAARSAVADCGPCDAVAWEPLGGSNTMIVAWYADAHTAKRHADTLDDPAWFALVANNMVLRVPAAAGADTAGVVATAAKSAALNGDES